MMKQLLIFILMSISTFCFSQNVNIPDTLFLQALIEDDVDTNGDGFIQENEAEAIMELNVRNEDISDLEGIQAFINLTMLVCSDNKLVGIDLTNNTLLTNLNCEDNKLDDLDLSSNIELSILNCSDNLLVNIDLSNNSLLSDLNCSGNQLGVLDVSYNEDLTKMDCSRNELAEIDVSDNGSLIEFYCSANELTDIDVSQNSILEVFHCNGNSLESIDVTQNFNLKDFNLSSTDSEAIDVSNNSLLEVLYCTSNDITNLDLSSNQNLTKLQCYFNRLPSLDIASNIKLKELWCGANRLETIDVTNNIELVKIVAGGNSNFSYIDLSNNTVLNSVSIISADLSELDVSNNLELEHINVDRNEFTQIDISNNLKLEYLGIGNNYITDLELGNNVLLNTLKCSNNLLSNIDLSQNSELNILECQDNSLVFLNIHNGTAINSIKASNNSELLTICLDEVEFDYISSVTDSSEVILSTDCSLGFPNDTYEITGNVFYSINPNCDTNAVKIVDLHFDVNNGSSSVYKPVYNDSLYRMKLVDGIYQLSLNLDNQELFNFDPDIAIVDLNATNSPLSQDFCFWPKDPQVVDAKITIIPIDLARPGFEVMYKILFENQGNIPSDGIVKIDYREDISQYITSSPLMIDDQGVLTYSYSDLRPFEKREIILTLRLNSPMDTPPLTDGIIKMVGNIIPQETELFEPDNHFALCQNVVNSFDPNDKTCLQGTVLLDDMIGNYVDYIIRFENTGTADAVNITIQDAIDIDKFDVSTLRVTDASHVVYLQTDRNHAKFIFEDINLPFQDELNDGYVAYKIKTLDDLNVGDSLMNTANIFFDFNFPIQTNTTITTIVTDKDNDGSNNLDDCDDENPDINPNQSEVPYNGIDDDCNALTLDDDLDQDGFILIDDCDDENADINPNQIEEPYNGIDDDCNSSTLDDDLDQDGYILIDDCDDSNPEVSPSQMEVLYNGIDDDCNTVTLDDDLDQDGFLMIDDCNDTNPDINPNAEDIPNNEIDEDCDGEDLILAIYELENVSVNIFPNPAENIINIEVDGKLNYTATLYDVTGKLLLSAPNATQVDVHFLSIGIYFLNIEDLMSGNKIVERIVICR